MTPKSRAGKPAPTWLDSIVDTKSDRKQAPAKQTGDDRWKDMLQRAREADQPVTDAELDLWRRGIVDFSHRGYGPDYVNAAHKALVGRNTDDLVNLMELGVQPPQFLLPVIAEIIKSITIKRPGRPSKTGPILDFELIPQFYVLLRETYWRSGNMTDKDIYREVVGSLAGIFGVSSKTIEGRLNKQRREIKRHLEILRRLRRDALKSLGEIDPAKTD